MTLVLEYSRSEMHENVNFFYKKKYIQKKLLGQHTSIKQGRYAIHKCLWFQDLRGV